MVEVGLSWLVYWLLVSVFSLESLKAALVVAILFIIAGILLGERPWVRHP